MQKNTNNYLIIQKVTNVTIDSERASQRIDNFLLGFCKGVPKTHIYKIIRKGEVRVNKSRIKASYKLQEGDIVRVPPIKITKNNSNENNAQKIPNRTAKLILENIIYEDQNLFILNKPSGIAVHGGSGINLGLIEMLRILKPEAKYLELVHRLDRDTSGCILIAKKRSMLRSLHEMLREGNITKIYHAFVMGNCPKRFEIKSPLKKNTLKSGERIVKVDENMGQKSLTKFKLIKEFDNCSLLEARPITGRTHQIRVHSASSNFPIVGDTKYGDKNFNDWAKSNGLKRLFLHAVRLKFKCPKTDKLIDIKADYDQNLNDFINNLK